MRKHILLILTVASLLISGCIAPIQPLPAQPVPISAAGTTGTEVGELSEAELAAYVEYVKAGLMVNPWQWTTYSSDTESGTVETPAEYLLTFQEDGTFAIHAGRIRCLPQGVLQRGPVHAGNYA